MLKKCSSFRFLQPFKYVRYKGKNKYAILRATYRVNQGKSYRAASHILRIFLQILSNRPMSITHDRSDLETDWRDSEFITECLCWHNVYRQRHNAPPLTMSPQVKKKKGENTVHV